jgi:ABC-type uncharacterized transport system permease subunit
LGILAGSAFSGHYTTFLVGATSLALVVPVILAALLFDGVASRLDGAVLLRLFAGWLVAVVREARRQRSAAAAVLGEHEQVRP